MFICALAWHGRAAAVSAHLIVGVPSGQRVVLRTAEQEVGAALAEQRVVARLAEQLVDTGAAGQRVVADTTEEGWLSAARR